MEIQYVKGSPYFSNVKNKLKQYSYLNKQLKCDILVVGGGIDGAITLYYLAKMGFNCALIEKSRIGLNCTSVATALLEYQLDDTAKTLKSNMTKDEILACYKLNQTGLELLKQFVAESGNFCDYFERDTLLYGLEKKDILPIKEEYEFRKSNGFDVEFLNEKNNPFSFNLKAGLLSKKGGAEANPYLLTKQLILSAEKLGAKIFENTEAKSVNFNENCVVTNYEIPIYFNKIVCTTGYDTAIFSSKKLCEKFVSYSLVTNPIKDFSWHNKTLLQDNADPYHYIRTLPDKRIIIGGEDTPFKKSEIDSKTAQKKYDLLFEYLLHLFPVLKEKAKVDFQFCGAFSSTLNNVGLVGADEENPKLWFNLGYGANGIINSFIGAKMICSALHNKNEKFLYLFSPNRKLI